MSSRRLDGVKKLLAEELKKQGTNDEEVISVYVKSYIDDMSKEIIDLKKEQYLTELKKARKDEELKQYLTKTRKILYEGFFMAFIVGLAVNQITDLIGIGKGNVVKDILQSTSIISGILFFLSFIIFFWKFIVDILDYFNKERQ
jgi:hypothetical protein